MEEYKKEQSEMDTNVLAEIPEEVKQKLEELKTKLDNFKNRALKECKYISGIALLPPAKEEKEKINVLIVVDLAPIKDLGDKLAERDKILKNLEKIKKDVDKNIVVDLMDVYDIRESCFDSKYEVLQTIAMSAPLYDPQDLLAALRIAEVHKRIVIEKFEKYVVSYVAVGSLFRGDAKSGDIDIAVIIDDTDVKKMSRWELRDRLGAIIREMGYKASELTGVKKVFHVQTYILTDFWESVKDAQPVIYTFLRDGVPLYDRGIFMPWKLLLKMGRIRPSPEAIEMQMDIGEKLIQRTKGKMLSVVGEDLYYAVLNPAQAALMLYGIAPPTPKETITLLEEIFVKKEKLLDKKYVDMLSKVRKYYKDIEHGHIMEVKGKDIDELLENANEYLKAIKSLFQKIEKRREKETIKEYYKSAIELIKDVLLVNKIKVQLVYDVVREFKKLVEKKAFPKQYLESLEDVIKLKEGKKVSPQELEKLKRNVRDLIKGCGEYIERKRGYELEKAKIKFKYGDKFGEALVLNNQLFVIMDIDAKEKEIQKAKIKDDGSLGKVEKSSMEEFEGILSSLKIPEKIFVKERIFESLKSLFGKDIEFLLNY